MLDEKQRRTILEMFSSGKSISEISRQVGVSRPSVYRAIASDVEKDAEILNLKKELRKADLRKKIEELREPIKIRSELDSLNRAVNRLMEHVLVLWGSDPEIKPPVCIYCGEPLEAGSEKSSEGNFFVAVYKCKKCKRAFYLG